jgi:hypothetical protein
MQSAVDFSLKSEQATGHREDNKEEPGRHSGPEMDAKKVPP